MKISNLAILAGFAGLLVSFWNRNDLVVGFYGYFHCFFTFGIIELYRYGHQPQNQRDEYDSFAINHLGVFCNGYYWGGFFPRAIIRSLVVDHGS